MGQSHNHPAMDDLVNLLNESNHRLNLVQSKLDKEFQQIYPDNANPFKLISRIKKIEEDVTNMKLRCQQLLASKQDLIDNASTTLVGNRCLVQQMQTSSGIPLISDDPAYTNLKQIMDEWTVQFRSKTGEKHDYDSEDINQLLFSAVVKRS